MANKYINRSSGAAAERTGSHAGIGVDSDDNRLAVNPEGTARKIGYCGYGKILTAATTLTTADFGGTYFLGAAGGFTVTLPPVTLGGRLTFVVSTNPTGGNYVITSADANAIEAISVNAAGVAGALGTVEDNINLIQSQAIKGDRVELSSDGVAWYATVVVSVTAAVTFTT